MSPFFLGVQKAEKGLGSGGGPRKPLGGGKGHLFSKEGTSSKNSMERGLRRRQSKKKTAPTKGRAPILFITSKKGQCWGNAGEASWPGMHFKGIAGGGVAGGRCRIEKHIPEKRMLGNTVPKPGAKRQDGLVERRKIPGK